MLIEAQGYARFGTATLSDALDKLQIPGQIEGIYPLDPTMQLAGPAFTLSYRSIDEQGGTVGDYIDDIPPGAVAVLDNRGRKDATVWGDILTSVAARRAIAGTVIDGVCRDGARSMELGYPMFTRGRWMRTGKDRVMLERINEPVVIGGVCVRPGDIMVGDADGVLAIPQGREQDVIDIAEEIWQAEERIREQAGQGVRLDEARRQLGYFALQTPQD